MKNKTISLELSKRLTEKGLLDDIDTEYFYWNWKESWYSLRKKWEARNIHFIKNEWDYKSMNLEEVLDFLPVRIKINWEVWHLDIFKRFSWKKIKVHMYYIDYSSWHFRKENKYITDTTLLGAIEKMLEYLLDNWLLDNEK